MKKETVPTKEDFFELIVSNPNQASPALQFGWCINNKGLEQLRENKVLHPFLLVVILYKNHDDEWEDYKRFLFPLDRGLGHVEFKQPGEYRIHASVIWTNDSAYGGQQLYKYARKEIYNRYMTTDEQGQTYKKMLHDNIDYRPDYLSHSALPYHDVILVRVDESLFAPEPPEWQKKWVNMFWSGKKPQNQCDWRRRKIFAFTLQPFLVFTWFILRILSAVVGALFCLVIGMYPNIIGWSAIFHPLRDNLGDIFYKCEFKSSSSYWWLTRPKKGERSRLEKVFMNPAVIVIMAFILRFYISALFRTQGWNLVLISLLAAIAVAGVIILIGRLLSFVFKDFFDERQKQKAKEYWSRKCKLEEEQRRNKELVVQKSFSHYYDQRLQPLACAARAKEATLASLPRSHRTLYLRFMDMKVKVCKPFRG